MADEDDSVLSLVMIFPRSLGFQRHWIRQATQTHRPKATRGMAIFSQTVGRRGGSWGAAHTRWGSTAPSRL